MTTPHSHSQLLKQLLLRFLIHASIVPGSYYITRPLAFQNFCPSGLYPTIHSYTTSAMVNMEADVLSMQEIRPWLRYAGAFLSEADTARVKHAIQHYDALAAKYSCDIERRKDTVGCCGFLTRRPRLKFLKQAMVDANQKSRALRSLSSPIRRVPPEILSEIFLYCLPPVRFVRPSSREGPLLLTQVCGAWREVALSIPRLWASLEVRSDLCTSSEPTADYEQRSLHNVVSMMKLWLSRAGNCSLSLSIRGHLASSEAIRTLFNNVSHRWLHVRLDILDTDCPTFITQSSPPLLESFTLRSRGGLQRCQVQNLSLALKQAPRLRHFSWDNNELYSPSLDLNWSQLTHLTINAGISTEECLGILKHSRNLIDASFQSIIRSPASCNYPTVFLPNLRSLVFGAEDDISHCLNSLLLPSLRELVLNVRCWPQEALVLLFRRSRCPLESLNLYFPACSEQDFLECLEHVQGTLQEFTVQMERYGPCVITDNILDRLTYKKRGDKSSCLCPRLEVVAVYDCVSCATGHLADMLRSRMVAPSLPENDPSYVARVKVIELYDRDHDFMHWLKPLRDEGLILKIYDANNGQPLAMDPDDILRLKRLREEGLVLRVYDPSSGHFGEITDVD
ncbi:hypothetical protein BDQ17DRAFT_1355163 [Cyathus striatus]|nr:hypothetical protein BDQ17DRAFT_1355163 [Cyathus striatus]